MSESPTACFAFEASPHDERSCLSNVDGSMTNADPLATRPIASWTDAVWIGSQCLLRTRTERDSDRAASTASPPKRLGLELVYDKLGTPTRNRTWACSFGDCRASRTPSGPGLSGRTRTCNFLIRSQGSYPVGPRREVQCWYPRQELRLALLFRKQPCVCYTTGAWSG